MPVVSVAIKETGRAWKEAVADDLFYQAFYGGSEVRRLALTPPKPSSTGIEF